MQTPSEWTPLRKAVLCVLTAILAIALVLDQVPDIAWAEAVKSLPEIQAQDDDAVPDGESSDALKESQSLQETVVRTAQNVRLEEDPVGASWDLLAAVDVVESDEEMPDVDAAALRALRSESSTAAGVTRAFVLLMTELGMSCSEGTSPEGRPVAILLVDGSENSLDVAGGATGERPWEAKASVGSEDMADAVAGEGPAEPAETGDAAQPQGEVAQPQGDTAQPQAKSGDGEGAREAAEVPRDASAAPRGQEEAPDAGGARQGAPVGQVTGDRDDAARAARAEEVVREERAAREAAEAGRTAGREAGQAAPLAGSAAAAGTAQGLGAEADGGRSLPGATVADIPDQAYTGRAVTPKPTVRLGGRTLKEGQDYALSYSDNVQAGKASVVVTGRGAYTGTKRTAFSIVAPSVSYMVHVQTHGDQPWRSDGASAGTTGQSRRLEAIWMRLASGFPVRGGIRYRTHVQTVGWQGWRADGAESGTHGQSKRLEAIQVSLTGDMAKSYDVWYRVHAQRYGWMGWARNGESAGTSGKSLRLEGIQVVIRPKGASAPSSADSATTHPFVGTEGISVRAHVQRIGWMDAVGSGQTAGTTGRSLRVEALKIALNGPRVPGGIEGNAHVQGIGWQGWHAGTLGTTGEGRRVEAIQLRLTGEAASYYDVYYRVHVQNGGWMAWAKNGAMAGTAGMSTRVESVQVVLTRAGASVPSASGQNISQAFVQSQAVSYQVCRKGGSWQGWKSNGATASAGGGTYAIGLQARTSGDLSGEISYATHVSGVGWTSAVANGATSGSGSKRIEAYKAQLSGEVARLFNVWYRAYVHGKGWMGWAKNGAVAGSSGQSLALDAVQIQLASRSRRGPTSSEPTVYDKVDGVLASLSLEQKVAQLFVVTPEDLTGESTVTAAGSAMRNALRDRPVGGIIYFSQNLQNPRQTTALLGNTKQYSVDACGLVPFQCVDEEGGTVARIAENSAFGVRNVGDMRQIGASGDTGRARSAAQTMGTYLKKLGFNVDFAPVADIATAQSGVMDRRSFGSDPQLVGSMVGAQVQGFKDAGILCSAKHFPGVGAAEGDSHNESIYSNKTAQELQSWELVPFKSAISVGVPMIMVAHLSCTRFADGSTLPASINPALIGGLLRNDLGYDGLVITDAMQMEAVANVTGASRQGVMVIKAGGDLVLMPSDFWAAYDGLLAAVRSGEISEARINESVRRVIKAKMSL